MILFSLESTKLGNTREEVKKISARFWVSYSGAMCTFVVKCVYWWLSRSVMVCMNRFIWISRRFPLQTMRLSYIMYVSLNDTHHHKVMDHKLIPTICKWLELKHTKFLSRQTPRLNSIQQWGSVAKHAMSWYMKILVDICVCVDSRLALFVFYYCLKYAFSHSMRCFEWKYKRSLWRLSADIAWIGASNVTSWSRIKQKTIKPKWGKKWEKDGNYEFLLAHRFIFLLSFFLSYFIFPCLLCSCRLSSLLYVGMRAKGEFYCME